MGRSKWKKFFIEKGNQKDIKKENLEIINKNENIVQKIINHDFKVHTGQKFVKISITKEMLGHKVGEFVVTRAKYLFKQKKNQKKMKQTNKKTK